MSYDEHAELGRIVSIDTAALLRLRDMLWNMLCWNYENGGLEKYPFTTWLRVCDLAIVQSAIDDTVHGGDFSI